jgi:transposase
MQASTIGIDLAKLTFQIHGVDATGKVVVRKAIGRGQMAAFFANINPCLIPESVFRRPESLNKSLKT